MKKQTAAILVLGDLNRSPRMLNHSKAISEIMTEIDEISLIGFKGSDLRSDIANDKKIKVYFIPEKINNYLKRLPRIFFLLSAIIRIVLQIFYLFYLLLTIPHFKFIILQNPPGIPAIYICSIVCFIRRSIFVLDWHNYGYTILECNGRNKFICMAAKLYEFIYGHSSHINFCVSNAMKKHLNELFNINALTLPDQAMKNVFKRLKVEESHDVFDKYIETKNIFTQKDGNNIIYKEDRPLLMVSSTSWTPDEDFDLLLDSFIKLENQLKEKNEIDNLRKVFFIITGKGPLKDAFMNRLSKIKLKLFNVKSIWLDSDDYPKLLGSADLGICLHYSSSGYDLPMKVVDMFSAELPVCAVYYDTIKELVKENQNGFLFKDVNELMNILYRIIKEYTISDSCKEIENYRNNLKLKTDWISQWKNICYDVIVKKANIIRRVY